MNRPDGDAFAVAVSVCCCTGKTVAHLRLKLVGLIKKIWLLHVKAAEVAG